MSVVPADQGDRDRIVEDLDRTLFVEAGAGSGKTKALVDRVVRLVTTGRAELRSIAAITFTEKAGAELRDRVRHELELTSEATDDPMVTTRCAHAVDQLDGAAIGTLHSFAQRVLSENPIEAGLPPRVEVLDEVRSEVEFERRWVEFRDRLLADDSMQRTVLLLLASGVKPDALRILALAFDQNWDLVEERVPGTGPEPPDPRVLLIDALAVTESACAARAHCRDPNDRLSVRLDEIEQYAERLKAIDDEVDLLEELRGDGATKPPKFKAGNLGRTANWDCDKSQIQETMREAGDALAAVGAAVANGCAERIGSQLRAFTLAAAAERRASGRLVFHDLLVLSRALVRHPEHGAAVRSRLARRYRHLLLDEFQDTDPIQVELAIRIAAADPGSVAAGTANWSQVPVTPGHLFVVGDPKQSIYRFRRADISLFLAVRDRLGPEGGGVVELSANFRTVAPVIDWVNATFAELMSQRTANELPVPSQPEYVALQPTRPPPPVGAAVAVIGREVMDEASAGEMRTAEADAVAATVAQVLHQQWSVESKDAAQHWRRAKLGDITILVPARTSLPFLEDALDQAGIPYRAESSSLVYASRAVRDLLMTLRAVDDPTDELAVLSALRTPLFACGDDDLFRFRVEQRGRWNYLRQQPDTVSTDGPVHQGLTYLRTVHADRHWRSPAELLDAIARDRRLFELGFAEGRARDVWRRLRYVIDQARGWSEVTGGGLREYLYWVRRQTAEGARIAEAILPETDDNAVRIMTIHASKGLEFPITIVSGMSTAPQSRRASAEVAFPPNGGVGYRFGKHVLTEEFDEWQPIDEQMGLDERIRLLYVACTRAQDHLVVSLQRKQRTKEPTPEKRTNAELLVEGMGGLLDRLPDAVGAEARFVPVSPPIPPFPPPDLETWRAELDDALRAGSRPTTVAATALSDDGRPDQRETEIPAAAKLRYDDPTAGLQKRPTDLDLPPWMKGRYGTAVGRAVHGVLQTIDLRTGAGLAATVAAQCEAEAVTARRADVELLVRHALDAEIVKEAAQAPHWREVYACTPLAGGRLLEGYVDLLYRQNGLVVVDYKTAGTSDRAELRQRANGYRLQGASYALSISRTTGEPVRRVAFLFLTPDGPITIDLNDVDAAIAEVESQVDRGTEHVLG